MKCAYDIIYCSSDTDNNWSNLPFSILLAQLDNEYMFDNGRKSTTLVQSDEEL